MTAQAPSFIEQMADTERPWLPLHEFPTRIMPGSRSASSYDGILGMFDVEHSARYRPRDGNTFCNIFVWDATSAMYAEIPHWVNEQLAPTWNGGNSRELTCNALGPLLDAGHWGWTQCSEAEARVHAAAGQPAIAHWVNPHGHGHIAMIEPLPTGAATEVAQAGLFNGRHITLARSFGNKPVRFYWHN